jgi:hypothetical protein
MGEAVLPLRASHALPLSYGPSGPGRDRTFDRVIIEVTALFTTGISDTIREQAIAETPVCSFTLQIGKCSIR